MIDRVKMPSALDYLLEQVKDKQLREQLLQQAKDKQQSGPGRQRFRVTALDQRGRPIEMELGQGWKEWEWVGPVDESATTPAADETALKPPRPRSRAFLSVPPFESVNSRCAEPAPTINEITRDLAFQLACDEAGIKPTARQAAKWRRGEGKAWQHHQKVEVAKEMMSSEPELKRASRAWDGEEV